MVQEQPGPLPGFVAGRCYDGMMDARRRRFSEDELEALVGATAAALPRHPEVIAAWLFGSVARGEPARDVDVGVLLAGTSDDPFLATRIATDIEESGASLGLEVDVRPLRRTGPRFRRNVLADGRLIYDPAPAVRVPVEARWMSEWLDFRPVWERMRRAMLDGWLQG